MTVQVGANRVTREQVRKIWIKELQDAGIHNGPNGKQLHLLSYYEVRSLKVMEQVRNEQ
jgi:hypothetical protein